MKKITKTFFISLLLILSGVCFMNASGRDYYQIQVYRLNKKGQEARVDKFLKDAYLPALHRAGIKCAGVFKPIPSDTSSGKQIIVWLPLTSADQLDKIREILSRDKVFQAAGDGFLNAPFDDVPYFRKESTLLKSFKDAPDYFVPKFQTAKRERIYELRSYEGPTEFLFQQKVKMFNEGGEIKLFKALEFNAVFYAEVISGNTMPNLMYLTTFADMKTHDAHWDAFRNHPDWKKLSALEEYKNTVSKNVKVLLYPTDYSDF